MLQSMFPKVIGVNGTIGSGKSHFCELISREFGYKHLNCDKIFKEQILTNEMYKSVATKFFKDRYVNAFEFGNWNSSAISEHLFGNSIEKNMDAFNQLTRMFLFPILVQEINSNEKVVIEIATLKDNPISYLCDKIYCVYRSMGTIEQHVADVLKRDPNRNPNHLSNLISYQYKNSFGELIGNKDRYSNGYINDEKLIQKFKISIGMEEIAPTVH